ncbi:MAG: hypothetical protein NDI69_08540 [Bacteriovoracaceae bacterium]|nr:hypothetical protein [Bacteriovoracaceae bacterium]
MILSSCGKKSDGSRTGDSPLPPAPVIVVEEPPVVNQQEPDILEQLPVDEPSGEISKYPFPDLKDRGMRIEPPVVICFNNQVLNHEKATDLKNLLELIYKDLLILPYHEEPLVNLLKTAIQSLEQADPDSRFCPKIYLAIGQDFI